MTAQDSTIKTEILSDEEDNNNDGVQLMALEKLDHESPDLWSEKIPGLHAFVSTAETPIRTKHPEWTRDLTREDMDEMLKLASMDPHELVLEIEKTSDDAYRLGVWEAKEMSRAKLLGIFNKKEAK